MTEKQWDKFSLITGLLTVGLLILLITIHVLLPGDGVPNAISIPTFIVIGILGFLFVLSAFRKESGEPHVTLKTVVQTILYIIFIVGVLMIVKKLRGS